MFEASPGVTCVASYGCCETALSAWACAPPLPGSVILMDVNLPGLSGIACTRQIKARWPDVRVLVLTMFEDADTILESIHAGATGYLIKSTPPEEILQAVRVVHAGGSSLSGPVARFVLEELKTDLQPPEQNFNLTRREMQVLHGLVNGLTYRDISAQLSISLDTVRSHIRTLYKKMSVHSRHEVVSLALKQGLRPS